MLGSSERGFRRWLGECLALPANAQRLVGHQLTLTCRAIADARNPEGNHLHPYKAGCLGGRRVVWAQDDRSFDDFPAVCADQCAVASAEIALLWEVVPTIVVDTPVNVC